MTQNGVQRQMSFINYQVSCLNLCRKDRAYLCRRIFFLTAYYNYGRKSYVIVLYAVKEHCGPAIIPFPLLSLGIDSDESDITLQIYGFGLVSRRL